MQRLLLGLSALAVGAPAWACGGFFCDNGQTMDQASEGIVFAMDQEAGTVEAHVQIAYEGDASRFAWVVPVSAVPDVGLSAERFFQTLDQATRPTFWLDSRVEDSCERVLGRGKSSDETNDSDNSFSLDTADTAGAPGVDVVRSGSTGPFDWQVVAAASHEALVAWLADPDGDPQTADAYDLPEAALPKLEPYVAGGSYFVAVKLQSGSSAGDIVPIKLTYEASAAQIPIVLTSVAATPDMRLEVYVVAPKRAVPDSYLHVVVNEAAIDWLNGGSNYQAVVTRAANEAGGQAFATDLVSPLSALNLQQQLWVPILPSAEGLEAEDLVDALQGAGIASSATLLNLLRRHLPMPADLVASGLDESAFYNSLGHYLSDEEADAFDADAFLDDVEELIVEPLAAAREILGRDAVLTRLTSSMSPDEMTKDPTFTLNGDMPQQVSSRHQATLVFDCRDGRSFEDAIRWIELEDGRVIALPPDVDPWDQPGALAASLDAAGMPAAARIERTSSSGEPTLISDRSAEIDALLRDLPGATEAYATADAGCACSSTTPSRGLALLALLLPLTALRRRDAP